MDQTETLARLNQEKDYEDKLARDLNYYFLLIVDEIKDITPDEKTKIRRHLNVIISDSTRHSHMFNEMVQFVLENGENNY